MEFKFGQLTEVKDRVTGFQGHVTGRADYATGCRQYLVVPRCAAGEEMKMPEGSWIDEGRLIQVGVAESVEHITDITDLDDLQRLLGPGSPLGRQAAADAAVDLLEILRERISALSKEDEPPGELAEEEPAIGGPHHHPPRRS